jgi:hypothetical protein
VDLKNKTVEVYLLGPDGPYPNNSSILSRFFKRPLHQISVEEVEWRQFLLFAMLAQPTRVHLTRPPHKFQNKRNFALILVAAMEAW